jgi:ankyrin repeat protein
LIEKLIADYGLDVNCTDASDVTPLHVAAYYGKTNLAKVLLHNGANVLAKAITGNTPLHSAAHQGNFDVLKLILDRFLEFRALGYDYSLEIDALNTDSSHSPLMRAARGGYGLCCMQALLQCGADKHLKDGRNGATASDIARGAGYADLAAKIVSIYS